jgi:hypothetical protein
MTTFPTAAVLTVTTDRMMCELEDVVSVVEFVVDRKIYAHELGLFLESAGRAIVAAHPEIPAEARGRDWELVLTHAIDLFGPTYDLSDALRGVIADDRPPHETLEAARRAARETIRRMEDKR